MDRQVEDRAGDDTQLPRESSGMGDHGRVHAAGGEVGHDVGEDPTTADQHHLGEPVGDALLSEDVEKHEVGAVGPGAHQAAGRGPVDADLDGADVAARRDDVVGPVDPYEIAKHPPGPQDLVTLDVRPADSVLDVDDHDAAAQLQEFRRRVYLSPQITAEALPRRSRPSHGPAG